MIMAVSLPTLHLSAPSAPRPRPCGTCLVIRVNPRRLSGAHLPAVGVHGPRARAVKERTRCSNIRLDLAATRHEATAEGGVSDRRALLPQGARWCGRSNS